MTNIMIFFIKLFKKFQYLRGGYCKYYPTCSDYAIVSIRKHGALKGSFKTLKRLFLCSPFSPGGYDLP